MSTNKDPSFNCSIFLHKKGVHLSDIIDENNTAEISSEIEIHGAGSGVGKLFEFNPSGKKPDWESTIKLFDPQVDLSTSVNNSAVLTLFIRNRLMSLTFGYGSSKLNPNSIVSDFGRRASLNLVDLNKVRGVSDISISDTTLLSKKNNIGTNSSRNIFNANPSSFLKGISGNSRKDWKYFYTIGAFFSSNGPSLKASAYLNPEKSLKSFLIYIFDNYNQKLSPELSFIDNIEPINDNDLVTYLWKDVANKISTQKINNFGIAYPDTTNFQHTEEQITGYSQLLKNVNPGEMADHFITLCSNKHLSDVAVLKMLLGNKLFKIKDNSNNELHVPLKKSIIAEITYNNNEYTLFSGDWYKVNKKFLNTLNSELNSIEESSSLYPNHGQTNEKDYFPILEKKFGWENIDMKTYSPKNGTSDRIEVADFVSCEHEFIHVKFGHSESSKLSHLFFQGNNSGELMSRYGEQSFIDKINTFLEKNNWPITELAEHDRTIKFLIMKSSKSARTDIPLFSKISLQQVKRNLELLDFKVTYVLIDK